eukprot:375744_1
MIALLLAALFAVSESHMCLFSPYQRGGPLSHTDQNTKGADPCALTTPPCGGVNGSNSEVTSFLNGERISIVMQKNLDHFVSTSPGNFTVHLHHPNATVQRLGVIMDDADPTFSIYQVDGKIPTVDEGRYMIQAIYHTNNPNAPAAFYQCADVFIHQSNHSRS